MAVIFGTAGADTITDAVNSAGGAVATPGPDLIYGGSGGADLLAGAGGDDAINSSFGDGSTLDGGPGDDSLYGSDNGQYLIGGDGADFLEGAAGADTFLGGAGADTIDLYADDGGSSLGAMDSIVGFDTAAGDRIQFQFGFAFNTLPFYWFGTIGPGQPSLTPGQALPGGAVAGAILGYWVPKTGGDGWFVMDFDRNGVLGASDFAAFVDTSNGAPLTIASFLPGEFAGLAGAFGGSAGADSLPGSPANDTILGNAGDDTVDGGGGSDSLSGGSENDSLLGGLGNDTLNGETGNDTLDGGEGDDVIFAGIGNDSILGGPGSDFLALTAAAGSYAVTNIGAGLWSVSGPDGADTISGIERLGFLGQITWLVSSGPDSIAGSVGQDSIDGLAGNDTLIGNGGGDSLLGAEGNDSLAGGEGNDTLRGGGGNDTVLGNEGNDNIGGNSGADSLDGGPGNDTLNYGTTCACDGPTIQGVLVDLLAGTATDNWGDLDSIAGFESVIGSAAGDTMLGGTGADALFGDAGNDTLVGREGNDRLFGGLGADTLDGGAGDDFLRPFDGSDLVIGGPGFDTASYNGDAGPLQATIQAGMDGQQATVTSALGADTLSGIDALEGTAAGDRIEVLSVDTGTGIQIRGFGGADTIIGTPTPTGAILVDYRVGGVTGGVHVDLATGEATDGFGATDRLVNINAVRGTDFADTLLGSDLNDRFRGRGGDDSLDGRGGTFDELDYTQSPNGIVANLATGIVQDGEGGTDTVVGFEALRGSPAGDSILGSDAAETFQPYSGADTVDGGGGLDRVIYTTLSSGSVIAPAVPQGVRVDLVAGTAVDPWGETDILISIERVTGTALGDTLIGDAEGNRFNGRGGHDRLDGGLGGDYVEYGNAGAGVAVDLTAGTAQDGEGGQDTLISIEHVIGSSHDDTLTGVSQLGRAPSDLRGSAGDDLLIGIPGAFVRADYADQIAGMLIDLGAGTVLDRFGDTDTLVDIRGVVMFGDHADTLRGTAQDEWFSPSGGADSVDAGAGFDIISYAGTDAGGVTVNLVTQRATDSFGDTDTIIGFEAVSLSFGDDTVLGDAGDNLIAPNAGADSVDGGLGEDTISYALGFSPGGTQFTSDESGGRLPVLGVLLDLVTERATDFGGDEDTIIGFEHAEGSTANDTLRGSAHGNRLSGAKGNDVLEGREGDDTLAGGAGHDSLDGGTGSNTAVFDGDFDDFVITTLAGGRLQVADQRAGAPEGADTLLGIAFLQFADTVIPHDGPTEGDDMLEGTAAGDTIDALGGNDQVLGLAGADRLLGGSGNDTLDGGSQADTLVGGAGNDAYLVDDPGDRTLEAKDAGIDTVFSAISWTLGAHLEDLVLTGGAAINGTGNNLANVIQGNDAANQLAGAGKADTLIGGGGNDLYLPDATDTLIEQAGGGYDIVILNATFALSAHIEELRFNGTANARGDGNAEDNLMVGNVGANRLLGYEGNDTLNGGQGNDTLQGGEGADSLVGGEGFDRLDGGPGDDTYLIGDLDQIIELVGAGIDTVLSSVSYTLAVNVENLTLLGSGDLTATGNTLDNVLTGNGAANLLRGLAGADRLLGGQGGDTLEGGAGADTLTGGGGLDRFLWLTSSEGGDVLTDFRVGDDLLAFASAGFGGLAVGALGAANFASTAASAAVPQFIYTKASGVLAWDADGSGAGAAVTIATLTNKPTLAAGDVIIA